MRKSRQPKFYYKSNAKKRSDFALNLSIANAIVGVVLSGQNLYPDGGLELTIPDVDSPESRLKTVILSRGTLNSWITRRNVIPETGETLYAVLERAKRDYRIKELDERREVMQYNAEKILTRITKLRTSQLVRNMFGKTITREDGTLVRKENVQLLKVQADTAKFLLERLKPEVYGKNQEKVVVNTFSLADLRRESEGLKKLD